MTRFLEHRIGDPMFLRLIQRFLKAGVMEDGAFRATEAGTPQGGLVCDRHASRLAGASPAMALGRREHVGEGKGARRNSPCTLWIRRLARVLPEGSQ